jgi:hypothetical protein
MSFQSTSSCNIDSVNAMNAVHLYARTKEHGHKGKKYHWAIEMNEAREIYLHYYSRINTVAIHTGFLS